MDVWFIFLSVVFTVLAGFFTTVLFRRNRCVLGKPGPRPAPPQQEQEEEEEQQGTDNSSSQEALPGPDELQADSECTAQMTEELPEEQSASSKQEMAGDQWEQAGSVNRMSAEDQALRYMPGMLRTSQLEKMMSKEELENEQRVQQEQLAAIFRLLQENQDTFGEVTEKDMEDQLKLYSI